MNEATTAPTGLMTRLREETRPNHEYAESRDFERALLAGTLPLELYVRMLEQRFLIHAALEREVRTLRSAYPFLAAVLEDRLFQEPSLREDLAHFGVDPGVCTPCAATEKLIAAVERAAAEDPLALLGMYYVFEGSKNGARYIARSVRAAYGFPDGRGTAYLDPHGDQQRALWQEFRAKLDAAPIRGAAHDSIIAAAKVAFDCVAEIGDELLARSLRAS